MGLLNLIFGGITGIYQQTIKDILIFSSISNVGYIFYFLLSCDLNNLFFIFYYLVFYSFCLILIFLFLQQIYSNNSDFFETQNNKNILFKFDFNLSLKIKNN